MSVWFSHKRQGWGRALVAVGLAMLLAGCGDDGESTAAADVYPRDDELRLNHLQVIGSHNSYHIEPSAVLIAEIKRRLPPVADLFDGLLYTHKPLAEQFSTQGVRQIELDIFADPDGGLFANRQGQRFIGQDEASGVPALDEPGFKTLHIQDLDFLSTCWTFVECLQQVKQWSDEHPGHMPLMILVEAKDEVVPIARSAIPVPIGAAELDALDAEIRSVFPPEKMITPDDVRGDRPTLSEAIRNVGWPTLRQARGKVMFCLDNGGRHKADYIAGHASLRGRVMFTSSGPEEAEGGFVKLNDSIGDFDEIRRVVSQGFVVRTRADGDTVEARNNDTRPRDMALASGAQWVSTDYMVPDPRWGTDYQATIPAGMPARCNPISAPADCTALDIENPAHLRTGG